MDEHDRGPTHVVGARFEALDDARATLDAIRDRLRRATLDADVRPMGSTDYDRPVRGALLGAHLADGEAAAAIEVIRESGGELLVDAVTGAPDLPRWDEARPTLAARTARPGPHRIRARQQSRIDAGCAPDVSRARRRAGQRPRTAELHGLRVFRSVRELRDALETGAAHEARDAHDARDAAESR